MQINNKKIGYDFPCYIIGEIGINHNGYLNNALELIEEAKSAGFDAVKFQKRMVKKVYSSEELNMPRDSVFGKTNGDLKRGLEFGQKEYERINQKCKEINIDWFASCWDEESVDFIEKFDPPCHKIASPLLVNFPLFKKVAKINKPIILSTGMSNIFEINKAVKICKRNLLIIMQCTSSYPCDIAEINLRCIKDFQRRYDGVIIGYSGHENGILPTIAAVAMGASVIERHITLDKNQWGSDQKISLNPREFSQMIKDVRDIEQCLGDGYKKVYQSELPTKRKLRKT